MTNQLVHMLRWHAARWLDRWGEPAAVGAALALAGIVIASFAFLNHQESQRAADLEIAGLEAQITARHAAARARDPASIPAPLAPDPATDTRLFAALLGTAAQQADVQLAEVRFETVTDRAHPLRAGVTAQATYAQLKRFIGAALSDPPRVALLALDLAPNEGATPRLEAHLVFALAPDGQ